MRKFSFRDKNGNELINYAPLSIPIKEEVIINKSIEYFNDDEPCIIHRTFIMKKIIIEINEIVDKLLGKDLCSIKISNGIIWDLIEIPENTKYIEISTYITAE